MKRALIAVLGLLLLLLAACGEPLPPMATIHVDQGPSDPITLGPSQSAYFRLLVGGSAVRVDAYPVTSPETADLDLVVYNPDRLPIAVADDRQYFHSPFVERLKPLGIRSESITVSPTWSVNLPPNTGLVYLKVKNWNETEELTFRVEAQTRHGPNPMSGNCPSITNDVQEALLYLGETDCFEYTGSAGASIRLEYAGPLHPKLKLAIANGITLEPGETYSNLNPGTLIFVYDYVNRQVGAEAGFCQEDPGDQATLTGCNDGLNTGEYWIRIN